LLTDMLFSFTVFAVSLLAMSVGEDILYNPYKASCNWSQRWT